MMLAKCMQNHCELFSASIVVLARASVGVCREAPRMPMSAWSSFILGSEAMLWQPEFVTRKENTTV